jgi:type VI secretion system protein ImpC
MPNRFDFGEVNLRATAEEPDSHPTSETPFCIAILGDFSGRASRGIADLKTLGERRPYLIDRDNFDEVLSKLGVELHLPSGGDAPLVFRFSELEDFHPDRLLENEAFQQLRRLRDRLQDPDRFVAVANEVGLLPSQRPNKPPSTDEPRRVVAPNPVRLASSRSLLDEMIEETESRGLEPSRQKDSVHDFARQLAEKYAVRAPDARQPEVIAAVDRAIGDALRAILHHPAFQALEAVWRATFLLVRSLDTNSRLRLYLVDITRDELIADLSASAEVRESALYRFFVEKGIQTPGANPWSLIVGNYQFGGDGEDLECLSRLAKVAQSAGAVFLAEANSILLGCNSLADTPRDWKGTPNADSWAGLRSLPEAVSLALALPRFLLRLPYGRKTSPLESIEFEEFPSVPVHREYLWGNPAFAISVLLGQSFSEAGWEMEPSLVAQLNNLPLHVHGAPGDSGSTPCAEVLLTDEAVERILDLGLIPLIAYKGRDSVRVGRFQPVADGRRPLAGRWEA